MNPSDHDEQRTDGAGKPADKAADNKPERHPIKVTIRTLAGHSRKDVIKPDTLIADVTDDAVEHFVRAGELAQGSYALTLPRLGNEAELDATATARDVGVLTDDVLVLVSRKPQIDG